MLKIVYCFFIFSGLALAANAQDKKETLALGRYGALKEVLYFQNQGIILKAEKEGGSSINSAWEIRYYSKDLNLKYAVPVERFSSSKYIVPVIVGTPDAKYIYHIEPKVGIISYKTTNHYITRIDEAGTKKVYDFDKVEGMLGESSVKFADTDYLYYLISSTEKDADTKKKEEKTYLLKLSNADFSVSRVPVIFPELRDEAHSSPWNYTGNSENKIYLTSKTVKDDGTYLYDIITIDNMGKVSKKLSLNASLKSKFVRPTFNYKNYQYANLYKDPDFSAFSYETSSGSSSSTRTVMTHERSAFGNILIDEAQNSIFISGLSGPTSYRSIATVNNGYFIQKFDMEGNELWKKEYEFPQEVMDNQFITIHATPINRKLKFSLHSNGSLKLQLMAKDKIYSFNIDGAGNYISAYGNDFKDKFEASYETAFDPKDDSEALEYIFSLDAKASKGVKFSLYNFDTGDMLLESHKKMGMVNLLLFNH